MTNEQLFEDLSQLVRQTVGASEDRLRTEITEVVKASEDRLSERIDSMEKEMRDGFAGVGEAIEDLASVIDGNQVEADRRLDDHDTRLTKLESQAA